MGEYVEINLMSKRFCCKLKIKEKLTFIRGDSGTGKTEFTRRVSSRTSANRIEVSNGFDVSVLTRDYFYNIYKRALDIKNKNDTTRKQRETVFLKNYWGVEDNFPLPSNSIFIIDDEDFVKSHVFAVLFECDKSNYYIIINRSTLPSLSYSADEVYNFVSDGKNHTIEKYYTYKSNKSNKKIDKVFVEGIGADFTFFSKLFKNSEVIKPNDFKEINGGGKDNLIDALDKNISKFVGKCILLIIDFSGFGSNIEDLMNIVNENNLEMVLNREYLSFEYLLLKSNLINDDIDEFIQNNRLKYYSLEELCTKRLKDLTKGTLYSYNKSANEFSVCYYLDCCGNRDNKGVCKFRRSNFSSNKVVNLVKDTDFESFLDYI